MTALKFIFNTRKRTWIVLNQRAIPIHTAAAPTPIQRGSELEKPFRQSSSQKQYAPVDGCCHGYMSGGSDWMLVLTDLVWEYWPDEHAWLTGSVSPTEGRWRVFCGDLRYNNFWRILKMSLKELWSINAPHKPLLNITEYFHLRQCDALWLKKHKEKTSSCAINLLSWDNWQLHKSNTCRITAWIHSNFSKCVIICHLFLMLGMNLTFLVSFWLPFPTRGLLYPIALTS